MTCLATARLMVFSGMPLPGAPFSLPPWPGSIRMSIGPTAVTRRTLTTRSHGVWIATDPSALSRTTGATTPVAVVTTFVAAEIGGGGNVVAVVVVVDDVVVLDDDVVEPAN